MGCGSTPVVLLRPWLAAGARLPSAGADPIPPSRLVPATAPTLRPAFSRKPLRFRRRCAKCLWPRYDTAPFAGLAPNDSNLLTFIFVPPAYVNSVELGLVGT